VGPVRDMNGRDVIGMWVNVRCVLSVVRLRRRAVGHADRMSVGSGKVVIMNDRRLGVSPFWRVRGVRMLSIGEME